MLIIFLPKDETLTVTSTPSQSGPESNSNDGEILHFTEL